MTLIATTPPSSHRPIVLLLGAVALGFLAGSTRVQPANSLLCSSFRMTNRVEEDAPGTGTWGGECTCPDGQSYLVTDNNDMCSTLACVGGSYSGCTLREEGDWSHRRVHCAAAPLECARSAVALSTSCCNTWCTIVPRAAPAPPGADTSAPTLLTLATLLAYAVPIAPSLQEKKDS